MVNIKYVLRDCVLIAIKLYVLECQNHIPTTIKLQSIENGRSLGSKVKLVCSLVIYIFLYARESCTLMAELEKRIQAFEMKCY